MAAALNQDVWVGYDGVANALRTHKDQLFQMWFNKPEQIIGLREASIRAAQAVRAATDKKIVVLYSGGMDSEWILESFVLAKIPVTPLVIVYDDDLNGHDVGWARRYIERRGLTPIYEQLNLRDWYGSKAQLEIAELSQTTELAYTTQFQAMARLNDGNRFFITGYDEPGMAADDSGAERRWNLFYNERHYSVVKLFQRLGIPGIANWGRFSSELFAAYVCQPQWMLMAANMFQPQVWNSEMMKVPMFQSWFPFMEARPKYTGFEGALDYVVEEARRWQNHLVETKGYQWNQEWSEDIRSVWAKLGVTDR